MALRVLIPSLLKTGPGSSAQLPQLLKSLNLKKPFIVADPYLTAGNKIKHILAALEAENLKYTLFDKVQPDPTTISINDALELYKQEVPNQRCDCAVGIGGGSAIDSAKALSVLIHAAESGLKLRDCKVPTEAKAAIPIFAIPTTAGTGSEATRVTVISDTETHEKMLLGGEALLPTGALVDYELTMTKPFRLTADTGIDALCHAMEAYVSRRNNLASDALALAAMQSIPQMLPRACIDPNDRAAREALMLASTRAGAAFSNSSVTLIHGMSRPFGVHFGIPHGMSNAMLLPLVTSFSISGNPERYADCARAMGFAGCNDTTQLACEKLVERLTEFTRNLEVPTLQEFGVSRDRFFELVPQMSVQAIASGSPANNPVVPSEEQVCLLYERVWVSGEVP